MNRKINRKEIRNIINESIIDKIVDKAKEYLTGADPDILMYNRQLRKGADADPDLMMYVQKKGDGNKTQRGELILKKFGADNSYEILFDNFFKGRDASVMFDSPIQIEYGELEGKYIVGAYSQIIGQKKHPDYNHNVNKLRCGFYVANVPDPNNFGDVSAIGSSEDISYLLNTNKNLVTFLEEYEVLKSDPIAGRKSTQILRKDRPITSEEFDEIMGDPEIKQPSKFHDEIKNTFAQHTADKLHDKSKRSGLGYLGIKDTISILDSYNYDFEFNLPVDQSVIPDSALEILNKNGVTDHGTPGNGDYVLGIETGIYQASNGKTKRVAHLKMSHFPNGKDEDGDKDYYKLGRGKKNDRIAHIIISSMPQIEDLLIKGLNESKKIKNKKSLFEVVYGEKKT